MTNTLIIVTIIYMLLFCLKSFKIWEARRLIRTSLKQEQGSNDAVEWATAMDAILVDREKGRRYLWAEYLVMMVIAGMLHLLLVV